jgi:isocitrate dehydrogenase
MSTATKSKRPPATAEKSSDQSLNAALYDRFVEKSREAFEQGKEKSHAAWEKASEQARQQMEAAGEFSAEQGEAFKRFLRRDLEQTGADMQRLGKEAKVSLHPARVSAGALSSLAKILGATGDMLTSLSEKAEHALAYQSGEITMAGTLTCSTCGNVVHLGKTSVVPVCSKCQGTTFRKGY